MSFNREARRIVDGLCGPDQTPEDLLGLMTIRRADGREFSLEEFPWPRSWAPARRCGAEEIVMAVPDGRSITVLLNATPIRSEEGGVESVVITMQDMTPLEEMERLRAEFLGMVSHELRTPLTSIRGSATSMLDAAADLDPAEMRQFLRIIVDQADNMRDLIGDLLDVARIETGTLPVDPEPAGVAALVDRARNTFQSGGGGNRLDIDLSEDLPLVMADRRRIVQVIGNLLSNAARNSPESSVIQVSAVRRGAHVEVSVADQGRGISAGDLPHLFRKFSRIERGDRRGDTGLGLAICKGIVEAHGGRIRAESEGAGMGARFTFTLPGIEEAESQPAARSASSPGDQRNGERILVVDDDPQALRYVRGALSDAGYRAGGYRRPRGGAAFDGGGRAQPGPARHHAARLRRDRADEGHSRRLRRPRHIPVRVRQGRGYRQGLRGRGYRLHRQALLADGVGGQGYGGSAQAWGTLPHRAFGTLRAG